MQKKFKRLFLVFVSGLAAFILFFPIEEIQGKEPEYARIGALAPDFVTEDVYGKKIVLSSFRDKKPVLLAFWATWCRYCTKEIPGLKAFINKHRDRIQVIAVVSGESRSAVKNYVQKKKIDFPALLDEDRKIWRQYLVGATPTHFLIDGDGRIVTRRIGFASKRDLEALLLMIEKED